MSLTITILSGLTILSKAWKLVWEWFSGPITLKALRKGIDMTQELLIQGAVVVMAVWLGWILFNGLVNWAKQNTPVAYLGTLIAVLAVLSYQMGWAFK